MGQNGLHVPDPSADTVQSHEQVGLLCIVPGIKQAPCASQNGHPLHFLPDQEIPEEPYICSLALSQASACRALHDNKCCPKLSLVEGDASVSVP